MLSYDLIDRIVLEDPTEPNPDNWQVVEKHR